MTDAIVTLVLLATGYGTGRTDDMVRVAMKDLAATGGAAEAGLAACIEADYAAWLMDQARALRLERPEYLDWENIAEELEGMARNEERALESYLVVLLNHLLMPIRGHQDERQLGSLHREFARAHREALTALAKSQEQN